MEEKNAMNVNGSEEAFVRSRANRYVKHTH
jgi:hypothetical protein